MAMKPLTASELANPQVVETRMAFAAAERREEILDGIFDAQVRGYEREEPYRQMTAGARATLKQEHALVFGKAVESDFWPESFRETVRRTLEQAEERFRNGGWLAGKRDHARKTFASDKKADLSQSVLFSSQPPRALPAIFDDETGELRQVQSARFWPQSGEEMRTGTPSERLAETFELRRDATEEEIDRLCDRVRWAHGRPVILLDEETGEEVEERRSPAIFARLAAAVFGD